MVIEKTSYPGELAVFYLRVKLKHEYYAYNI